MPVSLHKVYTVWHIRRQGPKTKNWERKSKPVSNPADHKLSEQHRRRWQHCRAQPCTPQWADYHLNRASYGASLSASRYKGMFILYYREHNGVCKSIICRKTRYRPYLIKKCSIAKNAIIMWTFSKLNRFAGGGLKYCENCQNDTGITAREGSKCC